MKYDKQQIEFDFLLQKRIDQSIQQMKDCEPPEGYFLAFSGGKDSCVLLDLAKKAGVKFDAHYHLTTIDPPELVRFIKTFPEVQIDKPEYTFWQLVKKELIPPTRKIRYCCRYLKEGYGDNRVCLVGIRAKESSNRANRKLVGRCEKRNKQWVSPLLYWASTDIWNYIYSRGLRYCKLYDEGRDRLGCILCPYRNKHRLEDVERFPTYARTAVIVFNWVVKERKRLGRKCTWKDGQEMFDWWLEI